MFFIEDPIGDGVLRARVGLAGDVIEDLAALLVDAPDARCLESRVFQMAQQRSRVGRELLRGGSFLCGDGSELGPGGHGKVGAGVRVPVDAPTTVG